MIRVLIADDQPLIRSGLRSILEREDDIEIVGEAADGAQAVSLTRATEPDIVLMDIRMPVSDGLSATRQILQSPNSPSRVIILTTFDLDEYIHAGLRAGAGGFILKDSDPAAVVAAVRAVHDGDAMLSPTVTRRLIATYVQTRDPTTHLPATLTGRETEVLHQMADGSNAEIGRRLYLSEATVKTHVTAILAKLGVRDRLQAVVAAYRAGAVGPLSSD